MNDNKLLTDRHILLCIDVLTKSQFLLDEFTYLTSHFCGLVCHNAYEVKQNYDFINIYLCGNIEICEQILFTQLLKSHVYVIKELSYNYQDKYHHIINIGEVPINIHNTGVFFKRFFPDTNYFELIRDNHVFQNLRESNKKGIAYRKGIYLTPVTETPFGLSFNLLRCSSNLHGPSCNFRTVDNDVVKRVNCVANMFFKECVHFNHVLAQIYVNQRIGNKERKAKIKTHSDKTKDMSPNGLIAFCTFYECSNDVTQNYPHNHAYKNQTVLTKLRFKLKDDVREDLVKSFDVVLFPNSLFIISLETNRLYTHEIIPSTLPINMIPTRMGYVIRCSNVKAIYENNKTYIVENDEKTLLQDSSSKDIQLLRSLYFKENTTSERVEYPKIHFSMNEGDYLQPIE